MPPRSMIVGHFIQMTSEHGGPEMIQIELAAIVLDTVVEADSGTVSAKIASTMYISSFCRRAESTV